MDYADLEVSILKKDINGYPVEITFDGEQEFPRGVPSSDLAETLTAGEASGQDGVMLFQRLFSDNDQNGLGQRSPPEVTNLKIQVTRRHLRSENTESTLGAYRSRQSRFGAQPLPNSPE